MSDHSFKFIAIKYLQNTRCYCNSRMLFIPPGCKCIWRRIIYYKNSWFRKSGSYRKIFNDVMEVLILDRISWNCPCLFKSNLIAPPIRHNIHDNRESKEGIENILIVIYLAEYKADSNNDAEKNGHQKPCLCDIF